MQKNVSGQKIGAQIITAADGSAFSGSVTVYVTGDAGTQAVGSVSSGACTSEGNGYFSYAPAQAETNYDLIAFTFTGTGAIPTTVQVYTRMDANVTQNAGTAITASSGRQEVNMTHIAGSSVATGTAQLGVNVVNWNAAAVTKNSSNYPEVAVRYWRDDSVSTTTALQGWLSVSTVTTSLGNNIITAASIASDAITDAKVASDVTIASVTGAVGSVTGAVGSVTGNVGGNVTGSVGSVVGAVGSVTGNVGGNVTGSVGSVATGGITAASIATDAIGSNELAASAIDEIVDAVWDELKSGHAVSGSYGEAASDWASQTDLADIATDVNAIQAEVTLIHDDTGTSGVVVNAAGLATDAVTEIVTAIFANAPAESYATDGSVPTLAQYLAMIYSVCSQFDISSTTLTTRKLDGTTSAMVFTLDSATAPTSRTRSS